MHWSDTMMLCQNAACEQNELKDIQSELATIYLLVQLMLRSPQDEAKMIEEHLAYVNGIVLKRQDKRSTVDNEVVRIQESKKRKEFDKSKWKLNYERLSVQRGTPENNY